MRKIGWPSGMGLVGYVAVAAIAVAAAGCGDDKTASADSSASATTSSTSNTSLASNQKQPATVLEESPDFKQLLKTVPPPDGSKRAAAKTPSPSAKGRGVAVGKATVSDLQKFGNALIKAKAHPDVMITTNRGSFLIEVDPEGVPIGAANFIALAAHHFYDNLKFHRVEPNFVIQGGDPEGTGMGGPGYEIPDEDGPLLHEVGVVAWAKAGPNTAGSQFYITLAPAHNLDHQYTVFGKVIEGMDTVQSTQVGDVMKKVVVRGVPANLTVPNPIKK